MIEIVDACPSAPLVTYACPIKACAVFPPSVNPDPPPNHLHSQSLSTKHPSLALENPSAVCVDHAFRLTRPPPPKSA
eukprot:CAMPEP_0119378508 /NCGR_PEP_ID=MMETSP1334-20130426/48605_1 /TAXON_ID=127549 /ORGANISM="Calcidiscus leptoporus, Strain RCC1130" /LENGTH=76 /DNA_ID=CAMNT_0007397731 /DNA_START=163 /DNA_END=390 /DNA_ORIENTATION=+